MSVNPSLEGSAFVVILQAGSNAAPLRVEWAAGPSCFSPTRPRGDPIEGRSLGSNRDRRCTGLGVSDEARMRITGIDDRVQDSRGKIGGAGDQQPS